MLTLVLKSKKLINHFKKDVIMKKFLLILPILFATTTEAKADVEVRLVPPNQFPDNIVVEPNMLP